MRSLKLFVSAMAGLALMATALAAHAELGSNTTSIASDQKRIVPRMTTTRALAVGNMHEMTLDNGGAVREFTNSDGKVFAVSWYGPRRPDLRQLFGASYFNRMQADNVQTGHIHMRRALASTHSDFIVRTGGISSAQWGYALLPQAMPSGFDTRVLTSMDTQP